VRHAEFIESKALESIKEPVITEDPENNVRVMELKKLSVKELLETYVSLFEKQPSAQQSKSAKWLMNNILSYGK